jgi:hypothetical protein
MENSDDLAGSAMRLGQELSAESFVLSSFD